MVEEGSTKHFTTKNMSIDETKITDTCKVNLKVSSIQENIHVAKHLFMANNSFTKGLILNIDWVNVTILAL